MRIMKTVLGVLGVLLLVAAAGSADEAYQEVIDRTYPLSAGGTVSLENVNGDVTVEAWDRDEVRVHAVKSAGSQELLDELEVKIDATSSAVRIDTKYPSSRGWRDHGDEHRESSRHTKVEYTLTVPRTAAIRDFDLVNGDLLVVGVAGGVEADTVNGDIVVREVAGSAELETVNGGIELRLDRAAAGDRIDLEAVNGTIDLYLGSGTGAEIRAETVNGRLSNDFGIDIRKGKYVGASFQGSIGGGGAQVELETVNGRIAVHNS
jgi:DUF4097 and DUF4098 domain-containing protein YvlB